MSTFVIVLICFLLFLGGMLVGMSGGGAGMLMAALGAIFLDPRQSVLFAATIMLIAQASSAIAERGSIEWRIVLQYAPAGMIGGIIGATLLFWIPRNIPLFILGVSCILFVILRVKGWRAPSPRSFLAVTVLACINGIFAGMTRGGSILRSSFLLSLGLSPQAFVATSSAIASLQLVAQVCVYSMHIEWTWPLGFAVIAGVVFVPFGVLAGQRLLKRISVKVFERMQMTIIFLNGTYLLISSFR